MLYDLAIITGGEMSSSINPASGLASVVPGMSTSLPGTMTNIGECYSQLPLFIHSLW